MIILVEEDPFTGRLLQHLTHELRNIGFAIQVTLETTPTTESEHLEGLGHTRALVDRLVGLAGALEQLGRPRVASSTPCELGALLHAAIERIESKVETIVVGDTSRSIACHPEYAAQALANLIAVTGAHVVGPVQISLRHGERAEIALRDDGRALPADVRRLVGDPTLRRSGRSLGLGTAVARRLVESQGGSIDARWVRDGEAEIVVTFSYA